MAADIVWSASSSYIKVSPTEFVMVFVLQI